jgi:hypothetical protein
MDAEFALGGLDRSIDLAGKVRIVASIERFVSARSGRTILLSLRATGP